MRANPLATALLATALALPVGCGGASNAAETTALETFERFQDALFAGDAAATEALVTRESRPVVAALPWDRLAKRERLVPTAATDQRGCYHVQVRDPNDPNDSGAQAYVVVREYGRWVVDLVATAGLCNKVLRPTGSPDDYELRELTLEDQQRVQGMELDR